MLLRSNFCPFPQYFQYIFLTRGSNYMFICEIWLFHWYFPQFCISDMSKYGYLEVFQRVPSTSRQHESTVYTFLCKMTGKEESMCWQIYPGKTTYTIKLLSQCFSAQSMCGTGTTFMTFCLFPGGLCSSKLESPLRSDLQ